MSRKKRVLTVCAGGNVCSHAMAYLLKSRGMAAMPVGLDHFGAVELESLVLYWADEIIVMAKDLHAKLLKLIPQHTHAKVKLVDVGDDRWGVKIPPDLVELCKKLYDAIPPA